MSVDEGSVDEELNRADEDELSWPPLEEEWLVAPLPLIGVSRTSVEESETTYRLL